MIPKSLNLTLLLAALVSAVSLLQLRAAEQAVRTDPPAATSKSSPAHDAALGKAAKKVELNSASQEELEALPGVGPVTAKAIITARPFKSVNELTNVSGISHSKFATLKPMVTVKPVHAAGVAKPTPAAKEAQRSGTSSAAGKPSSIEKGAAKEATSSKETAAPHRSNGQKVELNTATKEELENLPGIGPVRAQAIIDGRPYSKPEDVMKVKGIKEGIYNDIKDQILVR